MQVHEYEPYETDAAPVDKIILTQKRETVAIADEAPEHDEATASFLQKLGHGLSAIRMRIVFYGDRIRVTPAAAARKVTRRFQRMRRVAELARAEEHHRQMDNIRYSNPLMMKVFKLNEGMEATYNGPDIIDIEYMCNETEQGDDDDDKDFIDL